jgi:hypothetical protein
MFLFLDTEFTDFLNCHLISLALVAEDGDELYVELTDYPRQHVSTFVRDIVEPLLGTTPGAVVGERAAVREAVLQFLARHPGAVVACDYQGDWKLLLELLGAECPARLAGVNIYPLLDQQCMNRYFERHQVPRHHALHDARANRHAYAQHATPVAKTAHQKEV